MLISISTANFYYLPFIEVLDIIKCAGFEYIELAGYWKGGGWEAAQHLKNVKPSDILKMIHDSELKISTFHDLGGVIDKDSDSIVSGFTYELLECGDDIPCIVLHTPHKMTDDADWWQQFRQKTIADINTIKDNRLICIENMPFFDGYTVPLIQPEEMLSFAQEADVYINFDTAHYAQCNIELKTAAHILGKRIKTIHLSDYTNGKPHLYIGEGELDFAEFSRALDLKSIYSLTIECSIPSCSANNSMCVLKCAEVKKKVENIFLKF